MRLNLIHNYKLKALALLIAVLCWGTIKQITNNEKPVLVEDVNLILPEGWAVRDKENTEIYVTFGGTLEDLLLLDADTVEIRVDLRNSTYETEKVITLVDQQIIYTGSNARIIDIRPSTLTVRLGREGQKQLPVIINRIGEPPEGLKLEAITATPQMVTLYGAQDRLEDINSLQTAPLNLADKIQSFEHRLEILPPSEDWVGRIDPPRIKVKVTLAGLTEERIFTEIPLLLYHSTDAAPETGWLPDPETVDVLLKGSPQLLDELDPGDIQAFISATPSEGNETSNREVKLLVPAGIDVIGIQPNKIRLRPPPPPTPTPILPAEAP